MKSTDVTRMRLSLRQKVEQTSFLQSLTVGSIVQLDDPLEPPWFEQGVIYQIDEFLFRNPVSARNPCWGRANKKVFVTNAGRLELYWRRGNTYFARQLTESESKRFCSLFAMLSPA